MIDFFFNGMIEIKSDSAFGIFKELFDLTLVNLSVLNKELPSKVKNSQLSIIIIVKKTQNKETENFGSE